MTRILFIPEELTAGSSERTPTLFRIMRARHEVVGLPTPWDRLLYDPARAKWPRYLLYLIDKAILGARGLRLARRYRVELVFCETAHHALPGVGIAKLLGIRSVWDSHGNVRLFSRSLGKGRVFSYLAESLERFLGHRVDALITVSEVDAQAYSEMGVDPSRIHVLPLSVSLADIDATAHRDEDGTSRTGARTPVLFFFGSFKYAPNREALEFIDDTLAPYLERNGVRCRIWIAGRDIPRRSFHPSVRVLGFVPNIYESIRKADLCLVPVWKGVGVITKVLDIMAVGTPVVLSSFAAQGIDGLQDGVHATVAPSRDAFPELVVSCLSDPSRSREMAARARRLIEERYDYPRHLAQLDSILEGRAEGDRRKGTGT